MRDVLIHNTHGKEDLERASLAFVAANTALVSGQQATVLLTIEGVRIATHGYAQGLQAEGFAPAFRAMRLARINAVRSRP